MNNLITRKSTKLNFQRGIKPFLKLVKVLVIICLLTVVGCSKSNSTTTTTIKHKQIIKPPELPELSSDWPQSGNNLWGDRFSPITQLTSSNLTQLTLKFSIELNHFRVGGQESEPIELGNYLYVTTSGDGIYAFNATTGALIWNYTPELNLVPGWSPESNRGPAVNRNYVFVLTADDNLLELNRFNGTLVHKFQVANPAQGYSEMMAPLIYKNLAIVGSSGGDEGTRGFIEAVNINTGTTVWKWYSVPPPGVSWNQPATGNHGGGDVWTTPIIVDNLVVAGTGNPSPDFYGELRAGSDPYTDSVVALNIQTGALVWATQEVSHDLWDSDAASPPVAFYLNNKVAIGEAGKDGYWYETSFASGNSLISPTAFVKVDRTPPSVSGTMEWPGSEGGANYGGSSFDPINETAIIAGINFPTIIKTSSSPPPNAQPTNDREDAGSTSITPNGITPSGTITGIDVKNGQILWQHDFSSPSIGGVSSTASGLVFAGFENGDLKALDEKTGKVLWTTNLGAPIAVAPILYKSNGKLYLAVETGGAESLKYQFPYSGPYDLMVFELR